MNWKKKKILVTGADGFIGSHLVERLIKSGAHLRAFTYYNSFNTWGWLDSLSKDQLKKIEVFSGDVRDPNGVLEAMKGVDIVFNLAALIGIPFSFHSPDSYVDTNIKGILNVLQAARKTGVERIIHTSTSEVFGTAQYVPMDENHPLNPQSPYAATKAAADHLALSFYHSFKLPVTILRPFNTFGSRQSARAVIPTIITQIYSGKRSIQLGNLKTTRDFNYVSNVVDGYMKLAQTQNVDGKVFNIGTNSEISILELVRLISAIMGKKITITTQKERLRPHTSEVERLWCNASCFSQLCGWAPKVSLEEGLKKTCQWIKANLSKYKAEIYNV
ncbi:MAG: NAD-dependent 4,6-dehydratase LegB [Candidatus Omnitrophota bacterium]